MPDTAFEITRLKSRKLQQPALLPWAGAPNPIAVSIPSGTLSYTGQAPTVATSSIIPYIATEPPKFHRRRDIWRMLYSLGTGEPPKTPPPIFEAPVESASRMFEVRVISSRKYQKTPIIPWAPPPLVPIIVSISVGTLSYIGQAPVVTGVPGAEVYTDIDRGGSESYTDIAPGGDETWIDIKRG